MKSLRGVIRSSILVSLSVFTVAPLTPLPAGAGTTYTDRASFLAATSGTTNIDFEFSPSGGFANHGPDPTFSGVTFHGNFFNTQDPDFFPDCYEWNSGDTLGHFGVTPPITVDLPPGTTAVGVDLLGSCGPEFPSTLTWTVSISTGDMVTVSSLPRPGRVFAGFTSNVPITNMTLSAPVGTFPLLDNFVFGVADTDHDSIPDADDECPDSDLSVTVVIDGCNSGVPNTLFPTGCTISDLIAACAEGASNHGQFVSCVSHLTNDLKKAGTITGQQKGAIQSCTAQADIP
jgi:hypothetical protein